MKSRPANAITMPASFLTKLSPPMIMRAEYTMASIPAIVVMYNAVEQSSEVRLLSPVKSMTAETMNSRAETNETPLTTLLSSAPMAGVCHHDNLSVLDFK